MRIYTKSFSHNGESKALLPPFTVLFTAFTLNFHLTAVKLAQSIRCWLWVREVVSSSPISTNALVKIECLKFPWTINSLLIISKKFVQNSKN